MIVNSEVRILTPLPFIYLTISILQKDSPASKQEVYIFIPHAIPHILFSFSRLVCYFKLRKCRQILHDVVFIIKGLNNLSTSIPQQLTSLSSFMSKEAQRRCSVQELNSPLVRNYQSRGGREQNRHMRLPRTPCPSTRGVILVNRIPIYQKSAPQMTWSLVGCQTSCFQKISINCSPSDLLYPDSVFALLFVFSKILIFCIKGMTLNMKLLLNYQNGLNSNPV